jgi:hypothetical protein
MCKDDTVVCACCCDIAYSGIDDIVELKKNSNGTCTHVILAIRNKDTLADKNEKNTERLVFEFDRFCAICRLSCMYDTATLYADGKRIRVDTKKWHIITDFSNEIHD